jgi:thiamine biosynthesis lipoprotein
MACEFQVFLNAGQYAGETAAAVETLDLISALEEQLSYFKPHSALAQLNALAADEPVRVEPEVFAILEAALTLSAETDGAYDITATPLWEAWGFARREGSLPSDSQLAEALSRVGYRHVELDRQAGTVRFLKPGMRLNLGSLGKGYALDRCAEKLLGLGIEHFLIHGGQSSLIAHGQQGFAAVAAGPESGAWVVGLRHPLRPDRRIGTLRLRNRALGTSGAQFQSFWHQGRRYGHILDPRTGQPAQHVLSVSVAAPSGMLADALSTAFYVMPPEAVLEYCRTRPELGVVLFCPAARAGGMEVRAVGFAAGDLTLWEPGAGPV